MKRNRQRNRRNPNLARIQEALAKKDGMKFDNKGLTAEQLINLSKDPKRLNALKQQRQKKIYNAKQRNYKRAVPVDKNGKEPYQRPSFTLYPSPEWFRVKGEIDVSIIVPLYKSKAVIKKQIESWDLIDDGLKKEIIYVSDGCPDKSHLEVIKAWTERKSEVKNGIGRIVVHTKNAGYATACNTGVGFSDGKHLIFLNADCTLTPNWIKPMIDLLEQDEQIGIVGNMQLKGDGTVDSCGSEWSWGHNSFRHIGRNVYKGEELKTAYRPENLPPDLLIPGERDMVTGCCFAIPKRLFVDIQGFDVNYRVGYWEDSDLNMKVKDRGLKIYFQPDSRIYHKVGHSGAGSHKYLIDNRKFFSTRWIDTGRIDKHISFPRNYNNVKIKSFVPGKVVGCVIACNEEEFLEASVDSVAPIVDEWVIVVGGNKFAHQAGMCDEKGYPTDNTLEIAHKLVQKYGGRVVEPPNRLWHDKIEMRNNYVPYIKPGNWMFMVDGDEIYRPEQLWRITELMKQGYECFIMQFWLFWNNMNTIGTGSWESYPQERVVKWRGGYKYRNSHLHVSNTHNKLVKSSVSTYSGSEKLFYHYSWVRPIEKIRQKQLYYKFQSGIDNQKYVDDVFLKWRENPESVRGKTHPKNGGDWTPFPGLHPPEIQKLIDEGKFNF